MCDEAILALDHAVEIDRRAMKLVTSFLCPSESLRELIAEYEAITTRLVITSEEFCAYT